MVSESLTVGNQSTPPLTKQQRRILLLLREGDLIWEIADDPAHRALYNEKLGRDQRILTATVTLLEQQGWIRRRDNVNTQRLDRWELTPQGRTITQDSSPTRSTPPSHSILSPPVASSKGNVRS